MKHLLSKSTFMYGCQCPKRLWLNKYNPKVANEEDEQQMSIFQKGTDAGLLAQELFPGGVNAQGDEEWHSQKTVDHTTKLLPVHSVIYEAAFMYNGILCAVDILVRKGKKYYAYEVKSTNSVKEQHVTDAALQYYVLSQCGIDVADFSIVHFNKEYIRMGALDIQQLFTAESVLEQVLDQQEFIEEKLAELNKVLKLKTAPEIAMGKQCRNPYNCNFTDHCLSLLPEAPEEPEPDRSITSDADAVQEFLNTLEFPLYFFDFETIMYGVPVYDRSSPYQQIPFQYSLHTLHQVKQEPVHTAFLGNGSDDPRPALLEQMLVDLGTTGSIITWNMTFEKGRLLELAKHYPEHSASIDAIIDRLVDLMVPFRKRHIYSEAFLGSYSIKKVLPVLVPELSYGDLEIQEGATASFIYGQLAEMEVTEQEKVRQQLLDYCHLDTLAMVRIWERVIIQ